MTEGEIGGFKKKKRKGNECVRYGIERQTGKWRDIKMCK